MTGPHSSQRLHRCRGAIALRLARLVFAMILASTLWSVAARSQKPVKHEPVITIDWKDTNGRDVLADVFRQAHARFKLVSVPPAKITVSMTRVPLHVALKMILRTIPVTGGSLTYEVKEGVYLVHPLADPPGSRKSNGRSCTDF